MDTTTPSAHAHLPSRTRLRRLSTAPTSGTRPEPSMPSSLKPRPALRGCSRSNSARPPWLLAPQESWLAGKKKRPRSISDEISGYLRPMRPMCLFGASHSMFGIMSLQAMPPFHQRIGGGIEYVGTLMSVAKFGGLFFAVFAPMLMKKCGMLASLYLSMAIGSTGTIMFFIAYWRFSPAGFEPRIS